MGPNDQETLDIARGLLRATESQKLKWALWEHGSEEYTAATGRFRYYLKARDEDDSPPFRLQIYAIPPDGSAAEESNRKLLEVTTSAESPQVGSVVLHLFEAVQLSTLGIGSLKDAILGDLGVDDA